MTYPFDFTYRASPDRIRRTDGAADCLAYASIRIGGQCGSGSCGKADLGQRTAHWGGAGLVEFSVVAARFGWAGGGFGCAGGGGEAARSAGRFLCGGGFAPPFRPLFGMFFFKFFQVPLSALL